MLEQAVADLRREWGLDGRRLDQLLAALAPPGDTTSGLVRRTAVPRRDVEAVLDRLAPWLRRDGDAVRLDPPYPPPPARPDRDALIATLTDLAAGLPPALRRLDHVSATPATMADRALFLTGEYALRGRTLLCVGDHDLTSVAVGLAEPDVRTLVVDVDHRLLGYLADLAREHGLDLTTAFADLRLGLPPALVGAADLAFTDPPYTPEGLGLFAARALAGLRRSGSERLVVAYGFSPNQLTRGFRAQSELHELRLLTEAVLPRFNRFDGAEAVGAAASLYVLRPTRWTWPVLERRATADPRIYTRGEAAAESAAAAVLAAEVVDRVDRLVPPGPERLLVGDGWPPDAAGRRIGLADFLARPGTDHGPAAVCLVPHFGASLPAALLSGAHREACVVVAPARDVRVDTGPESGIGRLLRSVVTVSVQSAPGDVAVVGLAPVADGGGDIASWLVTHPDATLGNAWREALLWLDRRQGAGLTRNEARAIVRAGGLSEGALGLRLADLPRAHLAALADAVAAPLPLR